jgi:hypothetical protein
VKNYTIALGFCFATLTHAMQTPPQADKKTITSSPEDWQKVSKFIDELDKPQSQLVMLDIPPCENIRYTNSMLAAIINKSIDDIKKTDALLKEIASLKEHGAKQ